MNFKEVCEWFPIDETWFGRYFYQGRFSRDEVLNKNLELFSLDIRDTFAFLTYNEQTKMYDSYLFCFNPIKGYINETSNTDEFYPAFFIPDAEWQTFHPEDRADDDDYEIITYDSMLREELTLLTNRDYSQLSKHEWLIEQVAYLFDPENYLKGYTITENFPLEN